MSRAHAELDGSRDCLRCHARGEGVAASKCLECHAPLRRRIVLNNGLHAGPDYVRCERCHIEHQGREFDLVWWGDEGIDAFDHTATGYPLEGKHLAPQCRDCHRSEFIAQPVTLMEGGKDLSHTLLGLDRRCGACHVDEHRGQFDTAACTVCHTQAGWQPASGFDHQATNFVLLGAHRTVACNGCHPAQDAARKPLDYVRFRGIEGGACADCHTDVHQGSLSPNCADCHVADGWKRVDRGKINHDQTAYPLRGRHTALDCDRCHTAGITQPLAFATCAECHADSHAGQFGPPSGSGSCEPCHSVEGFRPARFTLDDHQSTAYPLQGAHLAVSCDSCHQPIAVAAPETTRFRFASTACADCHADPHAVGATAPGSSTPCATCHVVADWPLVSFDHAGEEFALEGAHTALACHACHGAAGIDETNTQTTFVGLTGDCGSCHADQHRGQMAAIDNELADSVCSRCHTATDWAPQGFDHNRDTRYVLDGAHIGVVCARCHENEVDAGGTFVRYKPLPISCEGCHLDARREG